MLKTLVSLTIFVLRPFPRFVSSPFFVLDGCIVFLCRTQRTNSANIAGHDKPKAVLLNDELKVVRLKVIHFLLLRALFTPNLIGGLLLIIFSIG